MQTLETIIEVIPLALALIFSFFFYFSKGVKARSNKSLAVFFISFALVQSFLVFADYTDKTYGRLLLPLIVGGSLTIPPSMYFYVNSLTLNVKSLSIKKNFAFGGVFFVLNLLVYSVLVAFPTNAELYNAVTPFLKFTTLLPIVIFFPTLSIFFIYSSFKAIKYHQDEIGNVYSYEEGINLQWVKFFLFGFIFWFIAIILDGLFNFGLGEGSTFLRKHTYDFVTTTYVVFVGLKAIQQLSIDKAIANSHKNLESEIKEEIIAAKENEFETSKYADIWKNLENVMNTQTPFTNTDLTIYDLAKLANTNYKYLSRAIKQLSNQNFASYINSYRVEEAKRLLKNKEFDNYTIEALAEMSGFKSKSAFNTAFKKITGDTPSHYKKTNL